MQIGKYFCHKNNARTAAPDAAARRAFSSAAMNLPSGAGERARLRVFLQGWFGSCVCPISCRRSSFVLWLIQQLLCNVREVRIIFIANVNREKKKKQNP